MCVHVCVCVFLEQGVGKGWEDLATGVQRCGDTTFSNRLKEKDWRSV